MEVNGTPRYICDGTGGELRAEKETQRVEEGCVGVE